MHLVGFRQLRTCRRTRPAQLCADIVAKVFLGRQMRILRAADAFCARRREGPFRFIQNRSRTSLVPLKNNAGAESPKINFREIFWVVRFSTFAKKICQKPVSRPRLESE
jgi:hypothetical protein